MGTCARTSSYKSNSALKRMRKNLRELTYTPKHFFPTAPPNLHVTIHSPMCNAGLPPSLPPGRATHGSVDAAVFR
jgi:hypothetical protein